MSEAVILPLPDGATYTIPDVNDQAWGQNVTNFLVALPAGVPPRSGTFSLTGDLGFGSTYGLKSNYYKSLSSNIASAGVLRLAVGDLIEWRNNANGGNLTLGVNGSDQLVFNGITFLKNRVYREALTGTFDGNNAIFAFSVAFVSGSEEVFLGGVLQQVTTDYTITNSTTITFNAAPNPSLAPLLASYTPA
jgi:hypothetical protein